MRDIEQSHIMGMGEIYEAKQAAPAHIGEALLEYQTTRYGLPKEGFESLIETTADSLQAELGFLNTEKIQRFEHDPKSALKPSKVGGRVNWQSEEGYKIFVQLTSLGFSSEDIMLLAKSAQEGKLKDFIAEKIKAERVKASEILRKPENTLKLKKIDTEVLNLFSELGISKPEFQTPAIQFFGIYEGLIYSKQTEQGLKGLHSAEINFIGVQVTEKELLTGILDNGSLYAYNHEKWHSVSAEPFKEGKSNELPSQAARKLGLTLQTTDLLERPLGEIGATAKTYLDEGVTDLFTRITAERAGIFDPASSKPHAYDEYVNMAIAICLAMEGKKVTHEIKAWNTVSEMAKDEFKRISPEILKKLLTDYTSVNGMLDIGKTMDATIGKYSNMIMEYSEDPVFFRKFLERLMIYKTDKISPTKQMLLQPDYDFYNQLKISGVSFEELNKEYPFLV